MQKQNNNPYVINIKGDLKHQFREYLQSLPPFKNLPSYDGYLSAAAAAKMFISRNKQFAEIGKKIQDVVEGGTPGICIHGIPIGSFSIMNALDNIPNTLQISNLSTKDIMHSNEYQDFCQHPNLWAENASQLFYTITGFMKYKHGYISPFVNDYSISTSFDSSAVKHSKAEKTIKVAEMQGPDIADKRAVLLEEGQPQHKHALTILIGLHSAALDEYGNLTPKTKVLNFENDKAFLNEPIKRGTVMIIADEASHTRPKIFEKQNFNRLVVFALRSYSKMPCYSDEEINKHIENNFGLKNNNFISKLNSASSSSPSFVR